MTQPDGYLPDTAANYDSFGTYASKSQEDWEGELDVFTPSFTPAEVGFGHMLTRIPIIGDIIEVLTGVEDGDTNDLGTWVSNLFDGISAGLASIAAAIFNGWFGFGSGASAPAVEVQYTIESIKQAVINGYTVDTFTSSGTWTKPDAIVELVVVLVGGGRQGSNGSNGVHDETVSGGEGGAGGGYQAIALDPADVSGSVTVTVAAGGGDSSFGTHAESSAGGGGISGTFGYTATSSMPGAGGTGGDGVALAPGSAGTSGVSSAVASGGAGGVAGEVGAQGEAVSAAAVTKCGGGGGGGGGGNAAGIIINGNSGGAGGYPGGGGGGGGGAGYWSIFAGVGGPGGVGAPGCVWVFYR